MSERQARGEPGETCTPHMIAVEPQWGSLIGITSMTALCFPPDHRREWQGNSASWWKYRGWSRGRSAAIPLRCGKCKTGEDQEVQEQ